MDDGAVPVSAAHHPFVMAQLDCAIPLFSSGSDGGVLASLVDHTIKSCDDGDVKL